jgi:hypothetical protein
LRRIRPAMPVAGLRRLRFASAMPIPKAKALEKGERHVEGHARNQIPLPDQHGVHTVSARKAELESKRQGIWCAEAEPGAALAEIQKDATPHDGAIHDGRRALFRRMARQASPLGDHQWAVHMSPRVLPARSFTARGFKESALRPSNLRLFFSMPREAQGMPGERRDLSLRSRRMPEVSRVPEPNFDEVDHARRQARRGPFGNSPIAGG